MSHSRTVLSVLAVARVWRSGLNATEVTLPWWPVRGWPSWTGRAQALRSHSRTVWSSLPVARVRPSLLKATLFTERRWPLRVPA
jgi:hypothetical protein